MGRGADWKERQGDGCVHRGRGPDRPQGSADPGGVGRRPGPVPSALTHSRLVVVCVLVRADPGRGLVRPAARPVGSGLRVPGVQRLGNS